VKKFMGEKVEATTPALDGGRLRACSTCGFLRPIARKNPDSRALLEPARKNFGVCNAKIPDSEQALKNLEFPAGTDQEIQAARRAYRKEYGF
jgi:hypothetical protein